MVNVVGKVNQRQKDHDNRNNAVQESLTQLDKMRNERLGIFYSHVYGLSLDEGRIRQQVRQLSFLHPSTWRKCFPSALAF